MLTLLTFRIRGTLFGVDIARVREIDRDVEYTAVPGAPDYVTGLFNMRGRVVVLYNLPTLFGYTDTQPKQGSLGIVMETDSDAQGGEGFLIDQAGSVVHLPQDTLAPLPANFHGKEARYIRHVVKLERELLLLLDCDAIFRAGETVHS